MRTRTMWAAMPTNRTSPSMMSSLPPSGLIVCFQPSHTRGQEAVSLHTCVSPHTTELCASSPWSCPALAPVASSQGHRGSSAPSCTNFHFSESPSRRPFPAKWPTGGGLYLAQQTSCPALPLPVSWSHWLQVSKAAKAARSPCHPTSKKKKKNGNELDLPRGPLL